MELASDPELAVHSISCINTLTIGPFELCDYLEAAQLITDDVSIGAYSIVLYLRKLLFHLSSSILVDTTATISDRDQSATTMLPLPTAEKPSLLVLRSNLDKAKDDISLLKLYVRSIRVA